MKDEGKTANAPKRRRQERRCYLEAASARLLYGEPKIEPIPRIVEDEDETASYSYVLKDFHFWIAVQNFSQVNLVKLSGISSREKTQHIHYTVTD